jgi:hypothetical protein
LNEDKKDFMNMKKNTLKVEGNFRPEVVTLSEFFDSIQTINNYLPKVKHPHQHIYNLSEGAKFKETIPLHIKDVKIENSFSKENLTSYIQNSFQKYAINHIDTEAMELRLQQTYEIKNFIDIYANKKFSKSKNFIEKLTELHQKLLQRYFQTKESFILVYISYFEYMMPILVDFFNTKDLKDHKKHIEILNDMIVKELYELINIYISALTAFLENKPFSQMENIKAI